jgi:hypothetical protein
MRKKIVTSGSCAQIIRYLAFGFMVFLVMAGCGGHSGQSRDYTKLRPSAELAALSLQQDLMLIDYDRLTLPKFPKTYDLSPGEYVFEMIFYDTGASNPDVKISTGKVTTLSINAEPGKLYYVYPSFPESDQWQPEIREFVRPDDLAAYSEDFWSDLEKGLSIEQIMAKHFQAK